MIPHELLAKTLRTYSTESNQEQADVVGMLYLFKATVKNIGINKDQVDKELLKKMFTSAQSEYLNIVLSKIKK
jgi:hypothetical protein